MQFYLIRVSYDESPLLWEVVVQIGDNLHSYICFACTWGTYNLEIVRKEAWLNNKTKNRAQMLSSMKN